MGRYRVEDEGGVSIVSAASAEEAAREWVNEGDTRGLSETILYHVSVAPAEGGGEDAQHISVTLDPPEPPCTSPCEHEWYLTDFGGVDSEGVDIDGLHPADHKSYECHVCGLHWTIDAAATDPATRETFRKISYRDRNDPPSADRD